jgi:large subunit ribosomal protein L15
VKLNELKPARGSKKQRRRVGRGLGSGRGKTAGRGQKGQKSRSGFSGGAGWEGGRSRLVMRLPKRGFNRDREPYQIVNLDALNGFAEGDRIDADVLKAKGLIGKADRPVKLLGDGELEVKKLTVEVDAVSRAAAEAVQAAGGSVTARDDVHDAAEAAAEES